MLFREQGLRKVLFLVPERSWKNLFLNSEKAWAPWKIVLLNLFVYPLLIYSENFPPVQTASDVSEYNVLSLFYELAHKEKYVKTEKEEEKEQPPQPKLQGIRNRRVPA